MKIGILLIGIAYNDKRPNRIIDFRVTYENFMRVLVKPLLKEKHEVEFYLYTYNGIENDKLINYYNPKEYHFMPEDGLNYKNTNWEAEPSKLHIFNYNYISALKMIKNKSLDFVISTRFDIAFYKNPMLEGNFDYNKFNILFKEMGHWEGTYRYVTDTFFAWNYKYLDSFIKVSEEMITKPYNGHIQSMHNLIMPLIEEIGEENVNVIYDEFYNTIDNPVFILHRKDW